MVSERVKVHIGLAAAVVVLAACITSIIAGAVYKGDLRAGLPGSIAPDFSLRDAQNTPVQLADLRGDVVIVYFRGKGTSEPEPTTAPSNDVAAAGKITPPQRNESTAEATNAVSPVAPDLAQLSLICHKLNNPHLKVLNLEEHTAIPSPDSAVLSLEPQDRSVQTLIDRTGDVARMFKIDQGDSKPTFFVIDPAGVIRYRGNALPKSGLDESEDQALSPATQPSSASRIVQTLLSSEALSAQ